MEELSTGLKFVAGIAAVGSALLWWKASTIEIREGHPLADKTGGIYLNGVDVLTTYRIQSKWNKWAALATGASIMLPWLTVLFS